MSLAKDESETASQFAECIAALPPLPATAQEILTCFGDEFIDADKVTAVVDRDPGICAKLLGLANSAYFGLAEPVNCIGEAIARVLGVDTVRSLVLALAIQQSFNSKDCPAFNTERFWHQSLLIAECSKKIALADDAADDAVRDLAYSAGLCHNLGLMALVHMEPKRANTVLSKHIKGQEADTLSKYLLEEFATDHKILTAELARVWSLPEPMISAYQYRAFPQSRCEERLGAVLATAVAAVENDAIEEDQRASLDSWAVMLGVESEDLQDMAKLSPRQEERVLSLVSNMTR
ncbi:MAG: HDOD domain-containing protein [Woeseiaceae bacterium]